MMMSPSSSYLSKEGYGDHVYEWKKQQTELVTEEKLSKKKGEKHLEANFLISSEFILVTHVTVPNISS